MGRVAVIPLVLIAAGCASVPRGPAVSPLGNRLLSADREWVEETLSRLDLRHKVAQLVVPRVSGAYLAVGSPEEHRVRRWVSELGVGGLIETLGPPLEAAVKFNSLQSLADVPLLITADMEHGPGQLLNGGTVLPYGLENGGGTRFPPAMGMGAVDDVRLAWEMGRITALEGRAAGVHMNFAPVLDVNSNPSNPIINTRSFGADPELVSRLAVAQIRGMQEHGMLATAKHFPGHGDTDTDSHIDLPVIRADPSRADSIELPPYRAAIEAEVAAVMSAHIAFPALTGDSAPATLNPKLMDRLLRDRLGFGGLAVTDALDMGAIVEHYGAEAAPILALEAGADLLLQVEPADVERVIDAVVAAVGSGRLAEARIDRSVRRLLEAKASLGLHRNRLVDIARVPEVVGNPAHREMARIAAERSITLVLDRDIVLPVRGGHVLSIIYRDPVEPFAGRTFLAGLRPYVDSLTTIVLDASADPRATVAALAAAPDADLVVFAPFIRVGAYRGGLGLPDDVAATVNAIARERPTITVSFGNPYLLDQLVDVGTYVLAWAGWDLMQEAAVRALTGQAPINGRLPIPLPPRHGIGEGIVVFDTAARPPTAAPAATAPPPVRHPLAGSGMDIRLPSLVDSLLVNAIEEGAAPGGAVAIGRRGRLVLLQAWGRVDGAEDAEPVTDSTLYDLASLTKVLATTMSAMVLVDEGRLDLDAPVSRYLDEWPDDGAKGEITVRNLLRHDAGLPASAPLWRVARGRRAFLDGIVTLPLRAEPGTATRYSDLGLILVGFIVERVSGMNLDRFAQRYVFGPLGLRETGFNPLDWLPVGRAIRAAAGAAAEAGWLGRIAPTEVDTVFRMRHVRGRVHDENAYALGGVAGHAGLFSSARDLAVVADMLLGGGVHGDTRIVAEATLHEFTRRQSEESSRALGWDTPSEGSSAGELFSPSSFGHTGFTGTSIWVDRERDVFVVLLTNRVNPTRHNQRHAQLRRDLADLVQRAIPRSPLDMSL